MKCLSLAVGYIFLWITHAIPVKDLFLQRALPLPPSKDPFYVPPARLEDYQPGTILRNRSIGALSFGGVVPFQAKEAYQLLYSSTDSLGNRAAAVTTIIIPENANYSRVLSYQTAADSVSSSCSISYTLQLGSDPSKTGVNSAETLLIISALDQGWIVNIPDYEGLDGAFTSGIQAGQATLDSVRASLCSGCLTGISPQAEYQMWGYSGGSLASEWAAELQPSYAPELNFKGNVVGGLISNVTAVLYSVNSGPFAGLIPAGVIGLTRAYPELKAYVDKHLIPSKASKFYKASNECLLGTALTYAYDDMFTYFDNGHDVLMSSVPQHVLATTTQMGTRGTPKMPTFLYQAVGDEVSPIGVVDNLVSKLCSQGANIEYARNVHEGHATEAIGGSAKAFQFLIDRFNGVPVTSGCTTNNVQFDGLDSGSFAVFGGFIGNALLALMQVHVGPSNVFLGWAKNGPI
ncbi:hypothetical protein MFRU_011g01350 [Monilinia fructicola]|uniref:Uncharacterized protein n=1 Tax=Monilinia fructicola TaxID=38448 RepID=A0A5M9JQ82_MONFR|nr:hypothetical protein EYC84_000202 [Monilinia fructicola]KAG4030678.1 hypothetical protein MFRU_011g01350 [Monilinia fructicola]